MSRIRGISFALAILSCLASGGQAEQNRAPFFDARSRQVDYAGPGREQAAPENVTEVLIGYFGPPSLEHPQAGQMWAGASLAIEQANRRGGHNGAPFRLVARWSENPWGSGVKHVARMAYIDKVWAIIGGIDGPSTHLAEQVVAKARLALVNPASTDKTVNLANVPWMFSTLPQDNLQAEVLADAIVSKIGQGRFVLVSTVSHDCHLFSVELRKSLTRRKVAPSYSFEFDPDRGELGELIRSVLRTQARAVVLIAETEHGARIAHAMRGKGYTGPIFGGPWMGRHGFGDRAGAVAEGVLFPLLYQPGEKAKTFEGQFIERFEKRPDYLAAHAYDAVNLLVAAIRKAGLNRALIRDALQGLSPWEGVTGRVHWDNLGANYKTVVLGTIRQGRIEPMVMTKPSSTVEASSRCPP